MKLKLERGFTLLELLVVVAIIAILAAAIIINLNRARAEANDSRIQSDLRSVSDAIQVYQNSGGDVTELAGSSMSDLNVTGIVPELIPQLPTHPASNQTYKYRGNVDPTTGLLNYTLEGLLGAGSDANQCFVVQDGSPSTQANCPLGSN